MSTKHPIIAVTGSSGAGTSTAKVALEHIFRREGVTAATIEGDSFHRYSRADMKKKMKEEEEKNGCSTFSHFGPEANIFPELENLFKTYGETGDGKRRFYVHNAEEAEHHGVPAGEFTDWLPLPKNTDMMFYEGLHGCVVTEDANVAQHVDLKLGVVPVINLEWIQKIHRDTSERGYSEEAVMDTIQRRMHDYVHYIIPQFKLTDINFQRVPVVDTSDPIIARDIPTADESLVVIRFRKPSRFDVDFPFLLNMITGSFMSRRNTIVVPGAKMGMAMELILTPIIHSLLEERRKALK